LPKLPSVDHVGSHADPPCPVKPCPDEPCPDTPLELILTEMRRKFRGGDKDGAVALARIAAPYLHPRLPAATPAADLATMPDADLDTVRPQS
jgi:hypothetical protein